MDLDNVASIAIDIAREAGGLLRQGFGETQQIRTKSTEVDLVTEYDEAAERLITGRLRQAFPDHRLVAEEGGVQGQDAGSYSWYIDPLDGTNNFAHGYPVFCVSLALYEGRRPLLGVIFDPIREECFHAVAGGGAFLSRPGREPLRLQVSAAPRLANSLLATGFPYNRHTSPHNNLRQLEAFLKQAHGIRRAGSAALDMAFVAAGRLDGYWEFLLNSWDVAAGLLLVTEAGGKVGDMTGQPLDLGADKISLVASNPAIFDEMLTVLAEVADD